MSRLSSPIKAVLFIVLFIVIIAVVYGVLDATDHETAGGGTDILIILLASYFASVLVYRREWKNLNERISALLKGTPTQPQPSVSPPPPSVSPLTPASTTDIAADLERLSSLHERGELSDEEFEAAKARLL